MIKNETKHISPNEIKNVTSQAKAKNFYLVNLDGREIHNEQEYIDIMYKEFFFPSWDIPNSNYNAYMDWIEDLCWLRDKGSKGFVLIIDYYNSFLDKDNTDFKEFLNIEGFNDITRHWEYEVIKTRVGGESMPFNIYLVDR